MKLRNRKTGEIINNNGINFTEGNYKTYNSLAELNAEWEDVPEEPKEYWYIDYGGRIKAINDANDEEDMARKEIGNYFETREEAELTVRKLKAWKRLKDKGFKFAGYSHYDYSGDESPAIAFEYSDLDEMFYNKQVVADLDLLFGGEE